MVTLLCGVVAFADIVFCVDIDEDETVRDLKDAIKTAIPYTVHCDANQLKLFLANRGGVWLTEKEAKRGVKNTSGFSPMHSADAKLSSFGLLVDGLDDVSEEDALNVIGPVNVLAELPTQCAQLIGTEVNFSSVDDLLAFLEAEMIHPKGVLSYPHILDHESLLFRLVGREKAMTQAAECFEDIIKMAKTRRNAIPVCSGMHGLGKTRMLGEGGAILRDKLKLDARRVFSVVVPYHDEFTPQGVEKLMPIEASFSWRLLYRFFLHENCLHGFREWVSLRLPVNGYRLTLATAVQAIGIKLRRTRQHADTPFYLFLGIDDYQEVKQVHACRNLSKKPALHELLDAIADVSIYRSPSSCLLVLPMLVGTDWNAIQSTWGSTCAPITRIHIPLLEMDEMLSILEKNTCCAELLENAQVCRDLVSLGGVPRWVVEYLASLIKAQQEGTAVNSDTIKDCFERVWAKYVGSYVDQLTARERVRLAASAVAGEVRFPSDTFDGDVKWSKLRDSSVCLLTVRGRRSGYCLHVQIPYPMLQSVASFYAMPSTVPERAFARSLYDLRRFVDDQMFDRQARQSWGMFGACFYAVRINAMLVLGQTTVSLRELLPGALMSEAMDSISVNLAPSYVFPSANTFGDSTPQIIAPHKSEKSTIDWTSSGCVVVNDDDGAAFDIFFALEDARTPGKLVVIVDQRRRQLGEHEAVSHPTTHSGEMSVLPKFLSDGRARFVRILMNCGPKSSIAEYVVPPNCVLVSRDGAEEFYGTLASHPACWPKTPTNPASKSALNIFW